jgi:hypothetical protein
VSSGPTIPVTWLRRLHLVLILLWLAMIAPAILWWSNSVPFLVAVSLYANLAAHFSAWQGTRAEEANGE